MFRGSAKFKVQTAFHLNKRERKHHNIVTLSSQVLLYCNAASFCPIRHFYKYLKWNTKEALEMNARETFTCKYVHRFFLYT